jgi:four helix bundle protein
MDKTASSPIEALDRLDIWRDALQLSKDIYELSAPWPKSEQFGLTSQIRRCSVSIAANIAEGVGRGSPAEIANFSQIALGSVFELETHLLLSVMLNFTSEQSIVPSRTQVHSLAKRIRNFILYHRRTQEPFETYDSPAVHHQPPTTNHQPSP